MGKAVMLEPVGGGGDIFDVTSIIRTGRGLFSSTKGAPINWEINLPQFGDANNINWNAGQANDMFFRVYHDNTESCVIDLTVNLPTTAHYMSLAEMFDQPYGIKTVKITGNLSKVLSYNKFLEYASNLTSVDIIFDFTSLQQENEQLVYPYEIQLAKWRFVPKTLSKSLSLNLASGIDEESLVSLANCIADNTQKTLTLHNNAKAKLPNIIGTVADGTFTQDDDGDTTLQDFITTTKGWTIA